LRLRSVFRPGTVDRELASELQYHLDRQVAENLRAGMGPAEARAAALRAMGGVDQVAEACRDARGVTILSDLARDARYAVRALLASPVFAGVAILTLALGIGATTAIFSVVDGVILRPLAYPAADRLVSLGTRSTKTGRDSSRLTGGDLLDLRADQRSFGAFSGYWGGELGAQVAGAGQFVVTYWVEPAFFRVFGVQPLWGRTFVATDGTQRAVVGLGFAERAFGSGGRALGQRVSVEGDAYEIVGVMPRGFDAPSRTELWLPNPQPVPSVALNRTAFNFRAVARLAPGVSLRQAQARADALGARLAASFPDSNRDRSFSVTPLRDRLVSQVRATLLVLLGAVAVVLVIACVNVANLLLARATTRSHEIALRAALGASRWRIVRQLVAESLVLAACGGLLGVVLAYAGVSLLTRLAPASLPRLDEVAVDWRVMLFASGLSFLASLIFGLAPAWRAARSDVHAGLRQSAPRGVVGSRASRLRALLVVGEIALAFALAVSASLLIRSFAALTRADLGFRPDSVLVMYAHRPATGLGQYVRVAEFFGTIATRLSDIPGVSRVGAVMGLPAGRYGSNGSYWIEGRPAPSFSGDLPEAGFHLASPRYFAALGVPLLRGRDFDERDHYDTPFVAIVSRSLARQQFAGEDPIGRRIRCGLDSDAWMTIVGVVGDVRQDSPGAAPEPELYMPLTQHPYYANEVEVVVRSTVPPASLAAAVRKRMRALTPETAVKFTTLDEMISASIDTPRFRAVLFGAFSALALLLAVAGVYGVLAFLTAQRTAEFGLRVALGAPRGRLFGQVVTRAAALGLPGLGLGVGVAAAAGRLLDGMLFGLTGRDPATYVGVAMILGGVILAAAAVPAWRAARVDPVVALRQE
jgi:predicted permease